MQSKTAPPTGLESLEPRLLFSAAGLVPVGAQPIGALTGNIVYIHAGHGFVANNTGGGAWTTQRGETFEMIEDLGNQDQMTFLADRLFDAGATVVPLRPVGHQPNEVVLDNDDTEVTFTGAWSNSSSSIYFGDAGDVPYRFATTSATETATARYRPNIPEDGYYPIYAWTRYGSDRAPDQLYRVTHAGGTTEVTVDHTRVGNGMVYLGTYYFEQGSDSYVDISNRSSTPGRVVIADMIRFGNGVGDIDRGGGVSGELREDEAALYWIQWQVDHSQGVATSEYRVSSSDSSANVSAPPRFAEYMNREQSGSLSDRVFVSYHSNGGGGSGRGTLALYNGNNSASSATPNQFLLADLLGSEVNDDLVSLNGTFEHNWFNRNSPTLDRSDIEFGEIHNGRINNEFDATIVETAFHDNPLDAELMRDPTVRDAIARATVQGLVRYFRAVDGNQTPLAFAPDAPAGVYAVNNGDGTASVHWSPPASSNALGDPATGYRIYTSRNGYGFDGGTYVPGGDTNSATLSGLALDGNPWFFQVAAVNAGGESPGSEVAATIVQSQIGQVLIINGFDRLDRTQNVRQDIFTSSVIDRVRPRFSNSRDYGVQVARAIADYSGTLAVDYASNEAVLAGGVSLADYDSAVWILGEESSGDDTFNAAEQSLAGAFIAGGGNLFVTGAEVGWDLDNLDNGRAFYNNTLAADYVADDAGTYAVTGAAGSIFAGLSFSFDDGTLFYDSDFPDAIAPATGATLALNYAGGTGGGAGVVRAGTGGAGSVVTFGFPFETITTAQDRAAVMGRVLDFFGFDQSRLTVNLVLDNDNAAPEYTETGSWSTSGSTGYNGGTYRFEDVGLNATATWAFNAPAAGTYEVQVQYRAGTNRATNARYVVSTAAGPQAVFIDQSQNNLTWVSLGTFSLAAGTNTITLDAQGSSGGSVVIADAVRVLAEIDLLSGDLNGDGFVGSADLDIVMQHWGETVTPGDRASGDATGDGMVGSADLQAVIDQWGQGIVPIEPTSNDSPVTPAPLGGTFGDAAQDSPGPTRPGAGTPASGNGSSSPSTRPGAPSSRPDRSVQTPATRPALPAPSPPAQTRRAAPNPPPRADALRLATLAGFTTRPTGIAAARFDLLDPGAAPGVTRTIDALLTAEPARTHD
ncbi:fibronectin type III domain-containing protein [Phycisphaeraceae bacterium D3-23]